MASLKLHWDDCPNVCGEDGLIYGTSFLCTECDGHAKKQGADESEAMDRLNEFIKNHLQVWRYGDCFLRPELFNKPTIEIEATRLAE